MLIQRRIRFIGLGLAGAAVAAAAMAGAQAVGAQPGARAVTVATADQGSSAMPPILPPLSASERAELRQAEAQEWRELSYRLPAGARYSNAEMNVFAAEGYAGP